MTSQDFIRDMVLRTAGRVNSSSGLTFLSFFASLVADTRSIILLFSIDVVRTEER